MRYFNVRSKADSLIYRTEPKKVKSDKEGRSKKNNKADMLRSISNSSGVHVE